MLAQRCCDRASPSGRFTPLPLPGGGLRWKSITKGRAWSPLQLSFRATRASSLTAASNKDRDGSPLVSLPAATVAAIALVTAPSALADGLGDVDSQTFIVASLFYTVIGLLSIVTLGVAYISLRTWLDSRQEQEDRDTSRRAPAPKPLTRAEKKAEKQNEPDELEPEIVELKRKQAKVKRDKTKGFGSD